MRAVAEARHLLWLRHLDCQNQHHGLKSSVVALRVHCLAMSLTRCRRLAWPRKVSLVALLRHCSDSSFSFFALGGGETSESSLAFSLVGFFGVGAAPQKPQEDVDDLSTRGRSFLADFFSSGGGVGSLGGGVGERFLRTGYRFGTAFARGCSFSLASFGLLNRSSELRASFGVACAAFFLRSSASLASFEEPPRSLTGGSFEKFGTRWPILSTGTAVHGVPSNQL